MASFQVTLYSLFLGAQDTETGWFQKGYIIQTVTMAVIPKGSTHFLSGLGYYSRHDAVGFTNFTVKVGDYIKDSFDTHYLIVGLQPHTWGNVYAYTACALEEAMDFPFISGFFGFETYRYVSSLSTGEEFEDGFERGLWAL